MIVRQWKARATPDGVDLYREHFVGTVYPELTGIEGFEGAMLLAREEAGQVDLTVETRWTSMEAVMKFAGSEPTRAVVEENVAGMVIAYDDHVVHHDCLFEGKAANV